jgi:hypothetical protein
MLMPVRQNSFTHPRVLLVLTDRGNSFWDRFGSEIPASLRNLLVCRTDTFR